MASIIDFFDNYPDNFFDNWSRIQENIDKQLCGIDSAVNGLTNIFNRFDVQFKDYQPRLLKFIDEYQEKLNAFELIEPKVLSAISKLTDNTELWQTLDNLSSFISRLEKDTVDSLLELSSSEIIQHINSIQLVIPALEQQIKNDTDVLSQTSVNSQKETFEDSEKMEQRKINANNVKLYLEIIYYLLAILQIFAGFIFSGATEINISIGNDYSTNYYVAEVNNHYINNLEIDTVLCNNTGFRFVAEKEIKPRIKADCSSTVVDTLKLGKFVQIVDKYKKWVQIRWQNEDGTYSYGWIQNYKLAKFK